MNGHELAEYLEYLGTFINKMIRVPHEGGISRATTSSEMAADERSVVSIDDISKDIDTDERMDFNIDSDFLNNKYVRIRSIMLAQNITRRAPMYQPGAKGPFGIGGPLSTWCNVATLEIALALGFNIEALTGGSKRPYDINGNGNGMAKNIANAATKGIVMEISGEMAQQLANEGYLVIAAQEIPTGIGHLSTIRPSDQTYDDSEGPVLSNVGGRMGIRTSADAFYTDIKNIHFYYDPRQAFRYDPSLIAKENPVWWQ
jgi:hypothetical protein